jgi:hypothetical protein
MRMGGRQVEFGKGPPQCLNVVPVSKAAGCKQEFDIGAAQQLEQLTVGGERADRHCHRADTRRRQPADDKVGTIRIEQADVGAFTSPVSQ